MSQFTNEEINNVQNQIGPNAAALLRRANRISGANSLYFPENYQTIYHYVTFTALKFESVTRTSTINSDEPLVSNRQGRAKRKLMSITLPMPDQLNTSYNASYADESISNIGEVASTGAANINTEQANENFRNGRYVEGAQALAQQIGGGAAGGAIVGGLLDRLPTSATTGIGNVFGFTRNPQKVLQFNGVNFREHQFSFKLTPKNIREATAIQKIITAFKRHMLPKYGVGGGIDALRTAVSSLPGVTANGAQEITNQAAATSRAFFEYPDVFEIVFNNKKVLFSIGESVITGFTVDYHPQNYPAYVRSLSSPSVAHPASITISMTFKETDIVTREQVDENFR